MINELSKGNSAAVPMNKMHPLIALPTELFYKILAYLVENTYCMEEMFANAHSALQIWSQRVKYKDHFNDDSCVKNATLCIKEGLTYAVVHACNSEKFTLPALGIDNSTKLLAALNKMQISSIPLRTLNIDQCGIKGSEILAKKIGQLCQHLQQIDWQFANLNDTAVIELIRNKKLKTLSISATNLTTASIIEISKLPLRELHLYLASQITDEDVSLICSITSLRKLSLTYAKNISSNSVQLLQSRGFTLLVL